MYQSYHFFLSCLSLFHWNTLLSFHVMVVVVDRKQPIHITIKMTPSPSLPTPLLADWFLLVPVLCKSLYLDFQENVSIRIMLNLKIILMFNLVIEHYRRYHHQIWLTNV